MAAPGAFVILDKAILNMVNATGLLAANPANFKLALVDSAYVPDNAAHELFADVTGEIAAGNGYTAGGKALTGVALSMTAGVVKFTCDPAQWTAAGGSIPAWRRGVIYYSGTLNGKVNPVIGHFLGDSAPADVPATTAGNTLAVSPNAGGWLFLQKAA